MAGHDLGCGAGGGLTVNDVLGKAGIILGTNIHSPSHCKYTMQELFLF